MATLRISSAEMERDFSRYREAARHDPVLITNEGRDSLVLLSFEQYSKMLNQPADGEAVSVWELNATELDDVVNGDIPLESRPFDHEVT